MNKTIDIGIIEDDERYSKSIIESLEKDAQFRVIFNFSNAEDAHRYIKEERVPDIILHDIDLPKMNGIDSCKLIKRISPSIKILILTVFDDDDKIFNAIQNGAEGYVLKETQAERLQKIIHDINEGGSVLSPRIAAKVLKTFAKTEEKIKDYGLSRREKEILKMIADAKSKKTIASELFLSNYTVNTHIRNIYSKLHVHTQIELLSKVFNENLLDSQ